MQTILPERFLTQNKSLNTLNFSLVIDVILISLVFLIPLLYTPFSSEYFFSYRSITTTLVVVILLIVWSVKGIVKGYVHIVSIKVLAVLSILSLVIISGILFSSNAFLSFYGGFLNLDQPGYYYLGLIFIAFIVLNSKIDYKKIIIAFTLSITLSTLSAYFYLFNAIRTDTLSEFTLYGSSDRLMTLQIIAASAALYFLLLDINISYKVNVKKVLFALGYLINLTFICLSGNVIYAAIVLGASGYTVFLERKNIKHMVVYLMPAFIFVSLVLTISLVPSLRVQAKLPNFNYDPRLNVSNSWTISASVLKEKPLFGYGLGNYMKPFALFRPITLNTTGFWRHDVIRPFNDLFLYSSVLGLTGLLTYITGLIFIVYKSIIKTKASKSFELASLISLCLVSISILSGLSFVSYLVLTITVAYMFTRSSEKVITIKGYVLPVAAFIISLGLFGYVLRLSYIRLVSEYYYKVALNQKNLTESAKALEKAMALNPKESAFVVDYILLSKNAAAALSKKESLNNDDLNNLATFINYSLKYAEYLTVAVDPTNHAFWDLRGNLYADIVSLDKNALNFSVNAYGQALNYKPMAPDIYYKAGVLFYQTGNYRQASIALDKAITLKPNYASAIFAMAHTLEKLGFIDNSISALEALKNILPKEAGDDLKLVENDLDTFKKAREAIIAKANSNKPAEKAPEVNNKISNIPANKNDKISDSSKSDSKITKGSAPSPLANPTDPINTGTTNLPPVN